MAPEENELVRAGRVREPVLSLAARRLRTATVAAAGRRPLRLLTPWPEGHRWAAALTHDLDVVEWWPIFTLLRLVGLGRKGQGRRAGRTAPAPPAATGRRPLWRRVAPG